MVNIISVLTFSTGLFIMIFIIKKQDVVLKHTINLFTIILSLLIVSNLIFNSIAERANPRIYLFIFDRVIFSEILVSLFPFILFQIAKSLNSPQINKLRVLVFTFILFLVVFLIIETRTRAGWISFVITLFTFSFLFHKYSMKGFLKYLNITILVVVFSFLVSLFVNPRYNDDRSSLINTGKSIFDINYYSNQARISFLEASIKMFAENPIRGIGAGKWAGIYPFYSGESYTDENVDMNSAINPHNDYIEVLTEFGIFGFIIFIGFIFTGLYFLFKKSKNEIAYLPFFLSALGICVTMFFSFTKDNFLAMMVFLICMAAGYSSNSEFGIQNSEFFKKHKRHIRTLFLVIGVLMLCTGIWFKVMSYLNEREYLGAMKLKAQKKYGEMLVKLDEVSDYFYPVDMNKMPVDYYRGAGYFELQQYDKALEKFRNAREYMKYYPTIMNNEASALYMNGSISEAVNLFIEIKNLFPNYIEPQINLLSLYTNQNKITEAKNVLTEIEKKSFDGKYVKNYSVFLGIKNYLIQKQK